MLFHRLQNLPGTGESCREADEVPTSEFPWLAAFGRHHEAPAQDVAGLGLIVMPREAADFFFPYRPVVYLEDLQFGGGWLVFTPDLVCRLLLEKKKQNSTTLL